jgi:hypothetical protein
MNMKCRIPFNKALLLIDDLLRAGKDIEESYSSYAKSPGALTANRSIAPFRTHFCNLVEDWTSRALVQMKNIFEDDFGTVRLIDTSPLDICDDDKNYYMSLVEKMKILFEIREVVNGKIGSSLRFIRNRSCVAYYDLERPLNPNSKEHAVTKYMFEHDFSDFVANEDIEKVLYEGNDDGEIEKNVIAIRRAAEEVNKKTRATFGFSIFELPRGYLVLKKPGQNPVT